MNKILSILFIICQLSLFAQEDSTTSINFDFGLTRNKNVNLWPIFKRAKTSSTTEISALLNVISYQNNKNFELKHSHVLPLFFTTKTANYRDLRIGTTIYPSVFRYTKDEEKASKTFSLGEIAPYIRFLQISTSENGLEVDNNLFFFMWYNKSEKDKSKSFVTFPIVWYYQKPSSTYLTIAPIYSQGNFKNFAGEFDHSYKMISPLFWKLKNQEDTSSFLIPIYYSKHGRDFNTTTIFPLLLHRKKTDTKLSLTSLPFYHHSFTFKADSLSIEKVSDLKMISPLYWSYKTKESQNRLLFPLFDSYKDSSSHHFISLIYAKGETWYNRKYQMISPLFWNFKTNEDTTTVLAPFIVKHTSDKEKTTFIPLLLAWKKRTKHTTSYNQFPLLFTQNDTLEKVKKQSVGLLFYHKKSKTSQVIRLFPLFGYKKTNFIKRFVSPLYIAAKKYDAFDTSSTKMIFPIYFKTQNNQRNLSTIFPIYWSNENSDYKSFYILPLGGSGLSKNGQRSHLNITPFYWKIRKPNKTSNLVLPLWYSSIKYEKEFTSKNDTSLPKIDTIKRQILFPILWKYKDNYEQKLTLFPIYWKYKDQYRTHKLILPLYSAYDLKNTYSNYSEKRRTYGLIAYHFTNNQVGENDNYIENNEKHGLFPIYLHKQNITIHKGKDTTIKSNNILFPIYWNFDTKKSIVNNSITENHHLKKFLLFPILHYNRTYSDTSISILPLFYQNKTENSKTTTFIPLFTYYNNTKFNYQDLKTFPLIHWKKTEDDTLLSILPFFQRKNTRDYKRSLFIPFYLYQKNRLSQKSTLAITPFFWNVKNGTKSFHILFPVLDITSDTLSKNIGVLGFLFRYKSTPNTKSFKFIYPLIDYKKTAEITSFRFSPLFWMKKSNELSYHTLFPVYYYQKTSYSSYFNLLGGIYSHKTHNSDNEKVNRWLWSLIYNKHSDKGRVFRFGYFLYKNIETDQITENGVFPFYDNESIKEGKKSRTYFFKCFQSNEFPIEGSTEKYKEIKVLWFIRLASNYLYLHQKGLM